MHAPSPVKREIANMKTGISLLIFLGLSVAVWAGDTTKTQTRPFQISFVHPMSTNGIGNANSTNTFSLNLISGYAGGVDGCEIGSFANVVRNDVRGAQISGFVNVVGGQSDGVQLAGFSNVNQRGSKGVQAAGFANVVNDTSSGVQVAGFSNVNNGSFEGWQSAGFLNVNTQSFDGIQTAGFINVNTAPVYGIQASGFYNHAQDSLHGVQLAGFMNLSAGSTKGVQAAGFLNVSKKLKGLQIGFINYTDTLEGGTPIGFLSIVRKGGFTAFELSANETFPLGMQLKTGSNRFYNLFHLSARPGNAFAWAWGAGFGLNLKSQGRFRMNIDLLASHINEGQLYTNHLNLLSKAQVGFTWQIARHFAISAGPSFNCLVVNKQSAGELLSDQTVAPYSVFDKVYDQTRVQLWPGGFLSIRF